MSRSLGGLHHILASGRRKSAPAIQPSQAVGGDPSEWLMDQREHCRDSDRLEPDFAARRAPCRRPTSQSGLSLTDHDVAAYRPLLSAAREDLRREFRLIAAVKYHLEACLRQQQ
jgi:hypothetical protein